VCSGARAIYARACAQNRGDSLRQRLRPDGARFERIASTPSAWAFIFPPENHYNMSLIFQKLTRNLAESRTTISWGDWPPGGRYERLV